MSPLRNFIAKYSEVAVSANNRETGLNVEQATDTGMLVSMASIINPEYRREDNLEEMTGREERDAIYNLGALSGATLEFNKMQAQHAAFIIAYALNKISTTAAGTGYKHEIKPESDLIEPHSFTAAMKLGRNITNRAFVSMMVDTFNMVFDRDAFVTLSAGIRGTGKISSEVVRETVQALDTATQIQVANVILDGDKQNVHLVRGEKATDEWHDANVTGVSGDWIFIDSLGGASSNIDYDVIYRRNVAGLSTLPARIIEPTLRTSDLTVNIGGKWDGSQISGGHAIGSEINRIEWSFNNNLEIEFSPGGTGDYADSAIRGGREQTLTLARQLRDFMYQAMIKDNDYLTVSLKAEGPEFDTGEKYTVWIVFPKVGLTEVPVTADGRKLVETVTLPVLEDDTYGSVIAIVKNEVATYAA